MDNSDTKFQQGNTLSVKHGCFTEKIALSPRNQELVRNWVSFVMSEKHIKLRYVPLIQRAERKLIRLLKTDEYEDAHPDEITFKHDAWKISLENSFRLDLERLGFTPLSYHQIKDLMTNRDELKTITEVNFNADKD